MLSWSAIDTVLLDMDGTLLDLHFDNYFWLQYVPQIYASKHQLDLASVTRDLHARFEAERGKIEWYCLDFWSQQLGLNIAELKLDLLDKIIIRPWVEEFLQALQASNKQVILLTNAHRDSLNLKMRVTKIQHYFDALVSTHDYGVPKEEQALWHALQQDFPFKPDATLLIDDTEAVLQSAKDYGIGHLLTLRQPDSQNPARSNLRFAVIDHFDEVLPLV
ncbi:MAG: GMP/IMP nucleotidase [Pseudomonadales bacterium]|nr:GMP/IMP nucleotidase [Pseudomonadales bacterium]